MDNGNESAFPGQELDGSGMPRTGLQWGLTKREYFAAKAMQGILAGDMDSVLKPKHVAISSAQYADALLAELAKEQP